MTYDCVCYCGKSAVRVNLWCTVLREFKAVHVGRAITPVGIACFPYSMTVQCTVNVLCLAKDIYI